VEHQALGSIPSTPKTKKKEARKFKREIKRKKTHNSTIRLICYHSKGKINWVSPLTYNNIFDILNDYFSCT
jgi:hypothetical protein